MKENTWTFLARVNRARRARIENRPDTAEEIAERISSRQACERAVTDREARYPTITAENAAEALYYQEERTKFHLANTPIRSTK